MCAHVQIYDYTTFNMPTINDSSVISVTPKALENSCTDAMNFFNLKSKNYLGRRVIYCNDTFYTSFKDHVTSEAISIPPRKFVRWPCYHY
jgi:hypothetical protein